MVLDSLNQEDSSGSSMLNCGVFLGYQVQAPEVMTDSMQFISLASPDVMRMDYSKTMRNWTVTIVLMGIGIWVID